MSKIEKKTTIICIVARAMTISLGPPGTIGSNNWLMIILSFIHTNAHTTVVSIALCIQYYVYSTLPKCRFIFYKKCPTPIFITYNPIISSCMHTFTYIDVFIYWKTSIFIDCFVEPLLRIIHRSHADQMKRNTPKIHVHIPNHRTGRTARTLCVCIYIANRLSACSPRRR